MVKGQKAKFENMVIYQIKCKDENITEIYVGSTTSFSKRKGEHKHHSNHSEYTRNKSKLYEMIRENGGWDNWLMLEVKKFPCNDNNESRAEEERVRVELKATLNMVRCKGVRFCLEKDCKSTAEGKTDLCKRHGGGNRCLKKDCKSSTQGKTDFCVKHGGGKRCIEKDCKFSAICKTDFCKKHGLKHICITCNKTLSIHSQKSHEKTKTHLKLLETLM